MTEDLQLTSPPIKEELTEIFLKGVKQGQEFYFSLDKSEEILTKSNGLYFTNSEGKRFKGHGMSKCILV